MKAAIAQNPLHAIDTGRESDQLTLDFPLIIHHGRFMVILSSTRWARWCNAARSWYLAGIADRLLMNSRTVR